MNIISTLAFDESGISTHLGLTTQRISVLNAYFMLITDVKMLICSNEGKRVRQGYYEAKRSEKAKKVEGKKSWYLPKPLGESPSGPSARQKLQNSSPWKIQLGKKMSGSMTHRTDR
uniref:Uncharacterized protein n=1 Tax=Solanum tuberosum TaxID=4113 RepID=M1BIU7_SOLTU